MSEPRDLKHEVSRLYARFGLAEASLGSEIDALVRQVEDVRAEVVELRAELRLLKTRNLVQSGVNVSLHKDSVGLSKQINSIQAPKPETQKRDQGTVEV